MKRIPRIQIAGIKSPEEVQICIDAGADGLGLLLMLDYPRGDAISVTQARAIVDLAPESMCTVLITHSTALDEIVANVRQTGVSTLQIHNDSLNEMPLSGLADIRRALPDIAIIKVLHIPASVNGNAEDVCFKARSLRPYVDALILDSQATEHIDGRDYRTLGGTGCLNNWDVAGAIVSAITPFPVIHAGGLTPENVYAAIAVIRPYGVDVNSGVRKGGSVDKDPQKVGAFVGQAKAAFADTGLV